MRTVYVVTAKRSLETHDEAVQVARKIEGKFGWEATIAEVQVSDTGQPATSTMLTDQRDLNYHSRRR